MTIIILWNNAEFTIKFKGYLNLWIRFPSKSQRMCFHINTVGVGCHVYFDFYKNDTYI